MDAETTYQTYVTGNITHKYPLHEDKSGTHLPRLVKLADDLGIALPQEVIEHHQRAQDLRRLAHQTRDDKAPSLMRDLERDLGTGAITSKKALDRLPTALAAEGLDLQKRMVLIYAHAAQVARDQARRVLFAEGDPLLDAPRKLVEKALADSRSLDAQDLWDQAQAYATLLRTMLVVPQATGATAAEYMYAHPDLAAEYQAKTGKAITLAVLGQHREEFAPGIYSASDVVEAAEGYARPKAEQGTARAAHGALW